MLFCYFFLLGVLCGLLMVCFEMTGNILKAVVGHPEISDVGAFFC